MVTKKKVAIRPIKIPVKNVRRDRQTKPRRGYEPGVKNWYSSNREILRSDSESLESDL
jgi:hypothetical protein